MSHYIIKLEKQNILKVLLSNRGQVFQIQNAVSVAPKQLEKVSCTAPTSFPLAVSPPTPPALSWAPINSASVSCSRLVDQA